MQNKINTNQIDSYGPIEGLILLGGGTLLRKLCLWAKSEGMPVRVVTSPRHNCETVDDESLSDFFLRHKVENISTDNISSKDVIKFLRNTKIRLKNTNVLPASFCNNINNAGKPTNTAALI